ncbi:MAG: hypothetical protein WCJ35_23995 [Planctomycetota bacterium]
MNAKELKEIRDEIRELSEDIGRVPLFYDDEPFARFFEDPERGDSDNPDGITLNTGEVVAVGDTKDVMKEIGIPFHAFHIKAQDMEAPHFRMGKTVAKALWRFPKWDIVATTFFKEIIRAARYHGIEDLPYTMFRAFPHGSEDDDLKWVLGGD